MDPPSFFGKTFAHVFGICDYSFSHTKPGGLHSQVILIQRHHFLLAALGFLRVTKIQTRRTKLFADRDITAHRAGNQTAGELVSEVILGSKPPFKYMGMNALEIEHFHDAIVRST